LYFTNVDFTYSFKKNGNHQQNIEGRIIQCPKIRTNNDL